MQTVNVQGRQMKIDNVTEFEHYVATPCLR